MRNQLLACLALVALTGCREDVALLGNFNQTVEASAPLKPSYSQNSVLSKSLCLYEDNAFAHITRYYSYNTALATPDVAAYGTVIYKGSDSLFFSGEFTNMRGRLSENMLDIENGTHVFVRAEVACPPRER